MERGGISCQGKTELVTINGNLNVLRYYNEMVPYINNGNVDVLQQDNPRPDTNHYTRYILEAANINILYWPSRCPDMALTLHVWEYLGRKVRIRYHVNNMGDLGCALHEEWERIPLQFIRIL